MTQEKQNDAINAWELLDPNMQCEINCSGDDTEEGFGT